MRSMNVLKRLTGTALMTALFVFAGICIMPATVKAETVTGNIEETSLSYTYDDSTKALTITGEGELPTLSYGKNIVTAISEDITVESVKFKDCKITGSMSYTFYGCTTLTEIDLSGLDTSQVTDMSSMFSGCSGLTGLDLSGFNTSQVTDMWCMFCGCSGLTSLDLSSFDTSQVTDMVWMFNGCSGLTSLDLSNFDASQVTNMRYIFNYCSALEEIKTPKAMGSCTASLPAAFYDADMYENGGEYRTTTELSSSFLETTLKRVSTNGWSSTDGTDYWYEDGVKQGTEGRGKEIYAPDSDAWYWLDAEQGGAKAVSKDVYQEPYARRYADRDDGTGKWVRYDDEGKMVKGWDYTDAGTYYFDLETGTMAKGYAMNSTTS